MKEIKTKPYVFKIKTETSGAAILENVADNHRSTGFNTVEDAENWIEENAKDTQKYIILNVYSKYHLPTI